MTFDDKTSVVPLQRMAGNGGVTEQRSACFIVLTGSQAGRMYKLEGDEMLVGRATEAIVRIEDEGVSRKHARIFRREDGSVSIVDMGSTNGTFCNGERVDSRILQDGDKVQIGTTTILKFSYQDGIDEDFQRRQYESATRDALTGCFNKKYLLERLPNEISFADRHGMPLSLAMLDIDHFKRINDTYGHLAGDSVLRTLVETIQGMIRSDDLLARYGGEEFALVMRETRLDSAYSAVERLRRRVEDTTFMFEGQRITVTISAGIAMCVDHNLADADALIKEADSHLYRAKNNGRNRTECDVAP